MPSQEKSFFWNTPSPTRRAWQKGLLTGTAPAAYLVLAELYGGAGQRVENWQQGLFLGTILLLGAGGMTVERRPTLGRLLATAALAVTGGMALMRLFDAPGALLVLLLSLIGAISWMWSQPVRETEQGPGREEGFDPLLSLRVVERQAALVGG